MARKTELYNKIAILRERYFRAAVNKASLLTMIAEAEVAEQVYNSNAIENSTLSLEDTEKILLEIDLERSISIRELFEAKNLARVVNYINTKSKEQELNLEMMTLLHQMLLSNINDDVAGRFRKANEWVRVANHIAVDPKLVANKLEEALANYHARPSDNIAKRIARFHLSFEQIHPFVDGNGRIGRVLNNYLLVREGYVPINIKFIDRQQYYKAFNQFNDDAKSNIMEMIVARAITNSYHKRLAYLEGKEIISLADYAKRNRLSHSNLINKAKRQTIEAFLEKAKWKIGI